MRDAASGEAVVRRDIIGILFLVCAAFLRERPVLFRRLPRGLQLVAVSGPACCLAYIQGALGAGDFSMHRPWDQCNRHRRFPQSHSDEV